MRPSGLDFAWKRPGWRVWASLLLAVVVAVVVTVARIAGSGDAGPAPGGIGAPSGRSPVGTASATAPDPTPSSTAGDDSVAGDPATANAPAGALSAGTAFVRAWVAHAPPATAEQWWNGVSRTADPTLAAQLRGIALDEIPASRVTGPATGRGLGPTSAEVQVPTDAGRAVLLCVLVGARWLVSTVDLRTTS